MNKRILILTAILMALSFLMGRCSKNDVKVVDNPVVVYKKQEIPEPEIVKETEYEFRYISDKSELDSLWKEYTKLEGEYMGYMDSMSVIYTLMLSKSILGNVKVNSEDLDRDGIIDTVYATVPQNKFSDKVNGGSYTVDWEALVTGQLDSLSFDIDFDVPKPKDKSVAFGAGLKGIPSLDPSSVNIDVPLSFSLEKRGFEKGITVYPVEKAISFDFKYRFKYNKFRLRDLFKR